MQVVADGNMALQMQGEEYQGLDKNHKNQKKWKKQKNQAYDLGIENEEGFFRSMWNGLKKVGGKKITTTITETHY